MSATKSKQLAQELGVTETYNIAVLQRMYPNPADLRAFFNTYRSFSRRGAFGQSRFQNLNVEVSEQDREALMAYFNESYNTVKEAANTLGNITEQALRSKVASTALRIVFQQRNKVGV